MAFRKNSAEESAPPPDATPLVVVLLLLLFAAQCFWVANRAPLLREEMAMASPGPGGPNDLSTHNFEKPHDPQHSPLIYYVAQMPVRRGWVPWFDFAGPMYQHRLNLRALFLLFGILRGASLWYVAHRLFGKLPGLFALALYCFSSRMVWEASHVAPDVLVSWGFFGVIFLGIASAHTLYATPETQPWFVRWRRPALMGVALGICMATQFSAWIALPIALIFVLYLVPGKRLEAAGMVLLATAIGAAILAMPYHFDWAWMGREVREAIPYLSPAGAMGPRWSTTVQIARWTNPAFMMVIAACVAGWLAIPRARWFGNTSTLIAIIAVPLLIPLGPLPEAFRPWVPATGFLFMFAAGVFADLLDTSRRKLALWSATALVLAHAALGVARVAAAAGG